MRHDDSDKTLRIVVSIHAPVWGATVVEIKEESAACFNPRTRVGCDIVDCYVSAISDEDALRFRNKRMQVVLFGGGLFTDGVKQFPFAVPFDPRTGEPLTEAVLDE